MRMRRPLENVSIVAIEASLQLDNCDSTAGHCDCVVVAIFAPGNIPLGNEPAVLHEVEYVSRELSLVAHGCRVLTANAFDRASKKPAIVEFLFVEAMRPQRVRLGL